MPSAAVVLFDHAAHQVKAFGSRDVVGRHETAFKLGFHDLEAKVETHLIVDGQRHDGHPDGLAQVFDADRGSTPSATTCAASLSCSAEVREV